MTDTAPEPRRIPSPLRERRGERTSPPASWTGSPTARGIALWIVVAVAAIHALRLMRPVLVPLVLAVLLFCALDPLVDRLERRRVPRVLGAALALLLATGAVAALGYGLRHDIMAVVEDLPTVAQELRAKLRESRGRSPGALDKLSAAASEIERTAEEAVGGEAPRDGVPTVRVDEPAIDASSSVRWGTLGALALAGELTMVWFLSFFLLLGGDAYKRKLVTAAGPALSEEKRAVRILDDVTEQIQRFFVTLVLTGALVAVTTWLALRWLGIEQAGVWGVAAGLLNSIPYFGPLMVTVGLMTIAFVQLGTLAMAAYAGLIALAITSIEGWLVTPIFMGKAARMNEVMIFVGLLFWSWAWGVWGLFLAVPMMMMLKALCDHVEPLRPIATLLAK